MTTDMDLEREFPSQEDAVLSPTKKIKSSHVPDPDETNKENLPEPNPQPAVQEGAPETEKNEFEDDDAMDGILANMDMNQMTKSQPAPSAPIPVSGTLSGEDVDFLMGIKIFYQRLFPFKEFFRWLSYGNVHKHYFMNREFSFTLASDTYIRFQSYKDEQELKNDILLKNPVKIDIGAIYNIKPKDKKTIIGTQFTPLQRELVFDIDMTDYDEIRTCCSGAEICNKCWGFMTVSIQVIDRILKNDFGFKHRLWIYSGRRGVHCWICDDRARKLPADARRAIVSYLELVKGGESMARKVNTKGNLHPSLRAAFRVCENFFKKTMLGEMDILGSPEQWIKVLQIIPDEDLRKIISEQWQDPTLTSEERWVILVKEVKANAGPKSSMNGLLIDLVFQYSYPRLDSNVSIGLNHLLKSPFCVHPKTGRVCVPIDPEKCEAFDPFKVPTLNELIRELDESPDAAEADERPTRKGYEQTSLAPHMAYFKAFLAGMEESISAELQAKRIEQEKLLQF